MKTILFLLFISTSLLAQDYQKAKIDMHGGNFNSYGNKSGYQVSGFRSSGANLSSFLDKNSTKNTLPSKVK